MSVRYKKSEDIRTLLLDTAEALFAQRGYFGVSIRNITDTAQVRNASINYHFESKDKLFMAVIERRIKPLSAARFEKLNAISVSPERPLETVMLIAEAFAKPMLNFAQNGGPGWRNYCILVAHLAVQKFWGENAISKTYDAQAKFFLTALQDTFPKCDPYRIQCCFQFLLSTTLYAVCDNKRLDTLSDGDYTSNDLTKLNDPFFDYVSAGIMAVATNF